MDQLKSYLRLLDPIQNHALRLYFGALRTSPASIVQQLSITLFKIMIKAHNFVHVICRL